MKCWSNRKWKQKRKYEGMQRVKEDERNTVKIHTTINSTNLISCHEACGHINGTRICCICVGMWMWTQWTVVSIYVGPKSSFVYVSITRTNVEHLVLVTFLGANAYTHTAFFVVKNAMDVYVGCACVCVCVCGAIIWRKIHTLRKCVQLPNHFRRQLYLFVIVSVCRSAHGLLNCI